MSGYPRKALRTLRRAAATILAFSACLAASAPCAADAAADSSPAPVGLARIIETWRQRQARVRSVRFTWQQDRRGLFAWSSYQRSWSAKHDSHQELDQSVLWLGGGRLRYERPRWYFRPAGEFAGYNVPERGRPVTRLDPEFDQPAADSFKLALQFKFQSPHQGRYEPRRCVTACDGSVFRELFEPNRKGGIPEASITTAQAYDDLNLLEPGPVLVTFRPLDRVLGRINEKQCRVVGDQGYVNGRHCVPIEEHSASGQVRRYWVDVEREATIVRIIDERQGRPRTQLDVEYKHDAAHRWVPAQWTMMVFAAPEAAQEYPGREEVFQFASMRVTEYAINEPALPATFDLVLPKGTVIDEAPGDRYILEEGGRKRTLSQAELRALAQSHDAVSWRLDLSREAWLGLAGAAAFGLAGWMSWRKRRRTRRKSADDSQTGCPTAH